MTFLNPLLLFLLPLAGVPILLHILSLRRLPLVELSTFRFLFDSYVQQRRRLKLHEILLAVLRALFVLLLVFVVSRPVLREWGDLFGGSGREVTIVVDCSASMSRQTAGSSGLDRAKEAARAVVEKLSASDRVTLLRLTSRAEPVFSRLSADAEEIGAAIDGLKPSIARGNVFAALEAALDEQGRSGLEQSVFLITDTQKDGWKEVEEHSGKLFEKEQTLIVAHVGTNSSTAGNLALIGDPPIHTEAVVGLPIVLRPRVANYSEQRAETTLRILLDEKEIARFPLSLGPGESASREVEFVPPRAGVVRGSFRIEGDPFEQDNEYLFCVPVSPPIRVLLVNGNPDRDPFKDELVYLRTALTARDVSEEFAQDQFEPAGDRSIVATPAALQVLEEPDGAWDAQRLADVSVVVLADCRRFFGKRQHEELREFVKAGGGLILFPGQRYQKDEYRKLLGSPGTNLPPLLAVELDDPKGEVKDATRYRRLTALDFSHPVLRVFEPSAEREYFATTRFFRTVPIGMPKEQTATWLLAQLTGGDAALVEGRFGRGIVLLSSFPVTSQWSNLPLKPEFVPLMLRMVSYAKRPPELMVSPAVAPEAVAEIATANVLEEAQATVEAPTRGSSPIVMQRSEDDLVGKFDQTSERGYYRVDLTARRSTDSGARLHVESAFAVNVAPQESNFETAARDDVENWMHGANVRWVDLSNIQGSISDELGGEQEIWRPIVYFLFFVFASEFLLATLIGPRTRAEQEEAAGADSLLTRLTGVRGMDEDPLTRTKEPT